MKFSISVLSSLLLLPAIYGCDEPDLNTTESTPGSLDGNGMEHECFESEDGEVECDFAPGSGNDCTVYEDGSIVCSGGGEAAVSASQDCLELDDGTVICGSFGTECAPVHGVPDGNGEFECWQEGNETICEGTGGVDVFPSGPDEVPPGGAEGPVFPGGPPSSEGPVFPGGPPSSGGDTQPACWGEGENVFCEGGGGGIEPVDVSVDGAGAGGEEVCWEDGDTITCELVGGAEPVDDGCWEGDSNICDDSPFEGGPPVEDPGIGDFAGEIIHVCLSQGLMDTALAEYCYSVIAATMDPCGGDRPSTMPLDTPERSVPPSPGDYPDSAPPSPH